MKGTAGPEGRKRGWALGMARRLMPRFPELHARMRLAEMKEEPEDFLARVIRSSAYISAGLVAASMILLYPAIEWNLARDPLLASAMAILPILIAPPLAFHYLMLYPSALISRRRRELDYEIVFAGRHIAIALKSGMPLFDAFAGASRGYGEVSKELAKIVDRIVLGTPSAQAIREVAADNPSRYFTRLMVQIASAISSGADLASAMESVLEQISKEQVIAMKEYSQKLMPLVMFYMVVGIIMPSLGIVLATVIFSAIGGGAVSFTSSTLVLVFLLIATVQMLFLGFIESSRPRYII